MEYGRKSLEVKRGSGLRKEEKRSRNHKTWLTPPTLLCTFLIITCVLTSGLPISVWRHETPDWTRKSVNEKFSLSSISVEENKAWDTRRQMPDENRTRIKSSEPEKVSEKRNTLFKIKRYFENPNEQDEGYSLGSGQVDSSYAISLYRGSGEISSWTGINLRGTSERQSWVHRVSSSEKVHDRRTVELIEDDDRGRLLPTSSIDKSPPEDPLLKTDEVAISERIDGVLEGWDAVAENLQTTQAPGLLQQENPDRKKCASVEQMGSAAAGDTKMASLRLRERIRSYFVKHGARRVRQLTAAEFCARSFVLGKAQEDGFGNNMYKLLTAAGLGVILNRSLIIAESGATNEGYLGSSNSPLRFPFGNYLSYSDQAFSMREVKQLWALNDCTGKYNRSLILKTDSFANPQHSSSLCEDWTKWSYPILWFKDTQDTVALQFLLKNQNANFRSAATLVLGEPTEPDFRPNTFGELMMAIVEPKPDVVGAVKWALARSRFNSDNEIHPPDIALHLRMFHTNSTDGLLAAMSCISKIVSDLPMTGAHKRPRIVVVSDTPSASAAMKRARLSVSAEIMDFDYHEFLRSSSSHSSKNATLRADSFLPPPKRRRDWGPLPRWVAVVDFFLAARAKHAVVSGAHRRVGTTYAQLVAALAAAYTLKEVGADAFDHGERRQQMIEPARFYSSFQEPLLAQGLESQNGWGHSWRPFGGELSCPGQPTQCALTPLLPYAWWDGPWQSPSHRDRDKLREWGLMVTRDGKVDEESIQSFCLNQNKLATDTFLLRLPKVKESVI